MAYENGRLPDSALSPIAGGGRLRHDAAAAWNAMAAYIYRKTGYKIAPKGPDSSYRTYEGQVYWRKYWCDQGQCSNAAVPGTSNHGWGTAVDVKDKKDRELIDKYGERFGWAKKWSDAPNEWWHLKYKEGVYTGPDPGPDYGHDPKAERIKERIRQLRPKRKKLGRRWRRMRKRWRRAGQRIQTLLARLRERKENR